MKCPAKGTRRPDLGYETTKPLGTKRPTWVRNDCQSEYETSRVRHDHNSKVNTRNGTAHTTYKTGQS